MKIKDSEAQSQIKAVPLVAALMKELATELDLHYEDEDSKGIAPTLDRLRHGVAFLTQAGIKVPDAVQHTLLRFSDNGTAH